MTRKRNQQRPQQPAAPTVPATLTLSVSLDHGCIQAPELAQSLLVLMHYGAPQGPALYGLLTNVLTAHNMRDLQDRPAHSLPSRS